MFLVGLTGGIGTGKSTVASMIQDFGILIIDSDLIAREVVQPGKKAWKKIREEFGDEILLPDQTINRTLLGKIVFSDEAKRKRLNAITHPEIHKVMVWRIFKAFILGHQFVMLDIPLLFEVNKMVKWMHKVIVVRCEASQQISRIIRRDGCDEETALSRVNSQMPLEIKSQMADFVIDNSKKIEFTRQQVMEILSELKHSNFHWKVRSAVIAIATGLCGMIFLIIF